MGCHSPVAKASIRGLVSGEMRQHPQFDLGVVGGDDLPTGGRGEGLWIRFPRGPDRDVLEIRVAAGEPPVAVTV